jgi:hypothetical protein
MFTLPVVAKGQTACVEIKVTADLSYTEKGAAVVKLDFKGQSPELFDTFLIGPKGYFNKDFEDTIGNLRKGTYSVVIIGHSESNNFCQKFLEVIVI